MHAPPHRRRLWFLQFSLRTLLAVTTLAAVACAWYLQPPSREEMLAGGHLKLWRQVKMLPGPAVAVSVAGASNRSEPMVVNHGRWTLSDISGAVVCTGHYHEGEQAGRWTTYHPNGTRAVEGELLRGGRVGAWRTWHANGRLQSETTYAPRPRDATPPWMPESPKFEGIRSGSAKVWNADGKLQNAGSYADDLQDGLWAYYHADGSLHSQGAFSAGKRQGPWSFFDATGKQRVEHYTAGRTQAELERLLAQLAAPLRNRPEEHAAVFAELEALGEPAVGVIGSALESPRGDLRSLAACTLGRLGIGARSTLPQLEMLAQSRNEREQLCVQAAMYAIEPAGREAAFEPLLVRILGQETPAALELADILFRCDPLRREAIFERLLTWRLDAEVEEAHAIALGISKLTADLVPYLSRHAAQADSRVRVRIADIVLAERSQSFATRDDGAVWARTAPLVARLKVDPDVNVRAAAESADWRSRGGGGFGPCF